MEETVKILKKNNPDQEEINLRKKQLRFWPDEPNKEAKMINQKRIDQYRTKKSYQEETKKDRKKNCRENH